MKKVLKEWFINAPWGKIALISWGNPSGEPVLLVHGRQDSAATFIPLVELLPNNYFYVALDLPGSGWSDPFPIGVMIMRFHFVSAVEVVLNHLGWSQFCFIGHSMGCEQGLFYNVIYPGKIKKLLHLDLVPSLQRLQVHDPVKYYAQFYDAYYSNYSNFNKPRNVYTKRKAIEAVMRARGMTEELAEMILSRNLHQVGEDQYRLSWDHRLKLPAPQNYPVEYYCSLFSKNVPPSLLITASEGGLGYTEGKEAANKIISYLEKNVEDFNVLHVEGSHDVHVTHPERLAKEVCDFLNGDVKSKL